MAKNWTITAGKGLLAAGAVLGGLKLFSDRQLRRFEIQTPPTGQFIEAEGVRLHYVSKGAGRPVVFIHGVVMTLRDFTLSIFNQAVREHQAVAIDRPGHGHSDRITDGSTSPVDQARLIRAAIRGLGLEKPILVGHSFGGAVVMAYALEYPEDVAGVVTLGGYVLPVQNDPIWALNLFTTRGVGDLLLSTLFVPAGQAAVKPLLQRAFFPEQVPPGLVETMSPVMLRPSQFECDAQDLLSLVPSVREMSLRYSEIRVPLVIIHGQEDRIVRSKHAEMLHEAVPHSKLVMLPRTGHMLHHSHKDVVMDAIRFVAEQAEVSTA